MSGHLRPMRSVAVLAALGLMPLADATAQDVALRPGQRVRVTAPEVGLSRQIATFRARRGDMLVLVADTIIHCPVPFVTRLDVHSGRKPWGGRKGAGIGLLSGLAIGGGIGYLHCAPCEGYLEGVGVAIYAMAGGLAGGIIGGVAGASIKTDVWEEVPVNRLRVSVVPTRDGVGIGARIAF